MKFLKKGQIAILSLTAVVAVAGYINYKYDPERERKIGETVFVNGKDAFTYENQVKIYEEPKIPEVKKDKDPLATFKYERDNMNSELTESYNQVINNEASTKEKIAQYQEKLNDLISKKHLVNMVENIIKTNGVENVVVMPTSGNINIIIASKEDIPKEKIAIVQNIVKEEFKVKSSNISISVKKIDI
ncbi:MAG: SpoIIIAH-like family protein [Clostridia bacterium]